ncbi:MAG: hypothetical protein ABJP02_17165 [Parasphingorhabdus sp.]|uniref:hypothetical protein n=1 Tax=Parasphingorhabdus sp. TaxID=2709688 RepID=UPI003298A01F
MIWFDWLYWSAILVNLFGEVFFNGLDPEIILTDIIVLGFMGFVWYMIAQRANNIFRWIFTVLTFIGVGFFGLAFLAYNFEPGLIDDVSSVELWFSGIPCALELSAVICLFLERSQDWFESKE